MWRGYCGVRPLANARCERSDVPQPESENSETAIELGFCGPLMSQLRAFVDTPRLLRNLSRSHVYRWVVAARAPQTSTMDLNVVDA